MPSARRSASRPLHSAHTRPDHGRWGHAHCTAIPSGNRRIPNPISIRVSVPVRVTAKKRSCTLGRSLLCRSLPCRSLPCRCRGALCAAHSMSFQLPARAQRAAFRFTLLRGRARRDLLCPASLSCVAEPRAIIPPSAFKGGCYRRETLRRRRRLRPPRRLRHLRYPPYARRRDAAEPRRGNG